MEIVRIAGGDYERYEELLLKREALKKEAIQLEAAYRREFGELLIAQYSAFVTAVEWRKKLGIATAALNYGRAPDRGSIEKEVRKQMAEYYEELERRKREVEDAKIISRVSSGDLAKIKKIYREIAKLIHPDICPLASESPEIMDLWNAANAAYEFNDLKLLEEVEVIIKKTLEEKGIENVGMVIPDIDERIKEVEEEIDEIVSNAPYTFGELLRDPLKTQEYKDKITKETEEALETSAHARETYEEIMKVMEDD